MRGLIFSKQRSGAVNVGLSIYSLWGSIKTGKMTPLDAVQWIADNGGGHVEFVHFVVDLVDKDDLIKRIRERAEKCGLLIPAYSAAVDLLQKEGDAYKRELDRAFKYIDTARKLGAGILRSDLYNVSSSFGRDDDGYFEEILPKLVNAAQDLAGYARQYGITVTIENHGALINGSERVRRFVRLVNRDNYRVTLDVGNALCVDEQPDVCVGALLPWAAAVHFKDFYVRKDEVAVGMKYVTPAGEIAAVSPERVGFGGLWLKSRHGRYLRGAIVGHGEIDIREIAAILRAGGYDGNLTVEFEGIEDCELGSRIGMRNLISIVRLAEQGAAGT
jgi:sugar phosphate isomerase/epimerase